MALQAFLDSFAISTGAAGTTQARTGYGFQPSAIIAFGTLNQSATDDITGGLSESTFGFATSTTSRRCIGDAIADAAATSNTARAARDDAIAVRVGASGTVTGLVDISSFDADGMTFIIDDAYSAACILHVLALGGTDITNVFVGNFAADTGNATQAITGVGFQPDALLLCSISSATTGSLVTTHALMSVGIVGAAGAANNAILAVAAQDAANPSVSKSYCRNGESLMGWSTTATLNGRGYVSAMDADGFTVTWNANPSAAHQYYFLAIKGGSFSVGDVLTQTDTTTDITESGLSFSPVVGLLLSACRAASTAGAVDADYRKSVGAFTSTTQYATAIKDVDNTTPTVAARGIEYDNCYLNISATDTIDGTMSRSSLDAGGYTAVMTDADPGQAFVAHLLLGSASTGPALSGVLLAPRPNVLLRL